MDTFFESGATYAQPNNETGRWHVQPDPDNVQDTDHPDDPPSVQPLDPNTAYPTACNNVVVCTVVGVWALHGRYVIFWRGSLRLSEDGRPQNGGFRMKWQRLSAQLKKENHESRQRGTESKIERHYQLTKDAVPRRGVFQTTVDKTPLKVLGNAPLSATSGFCQSGLRLTMREWGVKSGSFCIIAPFAMRYRGKVTEMILKISRTLKKSIAGRSEKTRLVHRSLSGCWTPGWSTVWSAHSQNVRRAGSPHDLTLMLQTFAGVRSVRIDQKIVFVTIPVA